MAKSGQRRAFEDEAIQAQAPTEELRVTDRKAMDITANLDAEYNRSGVFFNPDFFNSLAEISSDIHGMRRTSNYYDDELELGITQSENNKLEKDFESNLKKEANTNAFDEMMKIKSIIEKKRLEAYNRGENFAKEVPNIQLDFEDTIDQWGQTSPYIAEQLTKYKESIFPETMKEAIQADGRMNERKALFKMNWVGDVLANDVRNGLPLDKALAEMPAYVEQLSQAGDVNAADSMNTVYNKTITNYAASIVGMVKGDQLTVDEGQAALQQVLVGYKTRRIEGTYDKETGEKRTYDVWITEESLKSIESVMTGLDKYRPKVSTIAVADAYREMIGYDVWKDSMDFGSTSYIRGTSLPKMFQDVKGVIITLDKARAQGDPNADKEEAKVIEAYSMARAGKVVGDALDTLRLDRGNNPAALQYFREQVLPQLRHDLNKGLGPQFRTVPQYMTISAGNKVVSLGLASGEELDIMLRGKRGVDADMVLYNYYQRIERTITKMVDGSIDSDRVSMMDAQYAESVSKIQDYMVPQNLVTTDGKGHYFPNPDGVKKATQYMSQMITLGKRANNGAYIGAPTSGLVNEMAKHAKALTPELKGPYVQAFAQACRNAGNYGGILEVLLSGNLSNEGRNFASQAAVYALVGAPNTKVSEAHINAIAALPISKTFTKITPQGAEEELKKHGFPNAVAVVDQLMASKEYQVPAEFKQPLRDAIFQYYLGDLEMHQGDKNYPAYRVDKNAAKNIISANFRNGAYLHASAMKNVDVNQLVSSSDASKKQTQRALERMGVKPGEVTTKINYRDKGEEIYVGGNPMYMTSANGKRAPFKIFFDNKPADMAQGKYNSAHTLMLNGATTLAAMSEVKSSAKTQEVLNKYGGGMNVGTLEQTAVQLMHTAAKEDVQRDWYRYFNSNFQNTKLVSAPSGVKRVTQELFSKGFFNTDKATSWQMDKYIDFLYTKMQNGKVAKLDMPLSTYAMGQGIPVNDLYALEKQSKMGWELSCLKEGHRVITATGGKSNHIRNLAGDYGPKQGSWILFDAQRNLKKDWVDDWVNTILIPAVNMGLVKQVAFGFEEIKPSNPKWAYLYKIKTPDGKTVFKPHYDSWERPDHFHVEFTAPWTGKEIPRDIRRGMQFKSSFIPNVANVIKTNVPGIYTTQDARACAVQGIGYKATPDDASRMGRDLATLNSNPVYKAQAYANKFAYFKNAFGSTNMAVSAMAGCKFRITYVNPKEVSSSLKSVQGKQVTAQQVVNLSHRFPYNAFTFAVDESDIEKSKRAINKWREDGK